MASSALNIGSAFNTIPGPPPYGTSSTTRWRSVVKSRRSCTFTSSVPRSTARPITPSARGRSNIAGKIVTMSNFIASNLHTPPVQLEQPVRRFHDDPPAGPVDLAADLRCKRDQNLVAIRGDHEPDRTRRPLNPFDDTDGNPRGRLDAAPDEIVPVERAFRQPDEARS